MEGVEFARIHGVQLVEELNKLRLADHLTDFTICIDKERLRVHKIVLAVYSDYFKAMLTSESTEEIKNSQVTLEDIDPEAVKTIVDFWYTGKLKLERESVCQLLLATSRFQARAALNMCARFARVNLTAKNCLSLAVISDRCNLVRLFEEALAFCLEDFEGIIKDTEILAIDEELLMKIISDDRLVTSDEINVFELVMRWIDFDEKSRSSSLDKLMSQVRFASIKPASLFKPSVTKLIDGSPKYRVPHERAKTILMLKDGPSLQRQQAGSFQSSPRKSVLSANRRLYVFGGYDTRFDFVNMSEVYDSSADQWFELRKIPNSIGRNLAVAISENRVYAMSDIDSCGGNCLCYNLDTNDWLRAAGFPGQKSVSRFLVALDGYIYSFGGGGKVNRYDLSRTASKSCAKMQTPRLKPGFAVDDHYIYVMGGMSTSYEYLRSVERYDSRQDKWEFVASMLDSRMDFSGCSYRGKIYVAGGSHGVQYMKQAEVYHPKLNIWSKIEPMNYSRHDFGLVELSGQIYAVGGLDEELLATNLVEAYNPDKNKWVTKKGMRNNRRGHCVLAL